MTGRTPGSHRSSTEQLHSAFSVQRSAYARHCRSNSPSGIFTSRSKRGTGPSRSAAGETYWAKAGSLSRRRSKAK